MYANPTTLTADDYAEAAAALRDRAEHERRADPVSALHPYRSNADVKQANQDAGQFWFQAYRKTPANRPDSNRLIGTVNTVGLLIEGTRNHGYDRDRGHYTDAEQFGLYYATETGAVLPVRIGPDRAPRFRTVEDARAARNALSKAIRAELTRRPITQG